MLCPIFDHLKVTIKELFKDIEGAEPMLEELDKFLEKFKVVIAALQVTEKLGFLTNVILVDCYKKIKGAEV